MYCCVCVCIRNCAEEARKEKEEAEKKLREEKLQEN
jgi:hypothetical protein